MKRRLFNVLAAVSLVMCVATVVPWVRSYWVSDGFGFSPFICLYTDRGELIYGVIDSDSNFAAAELGYSANELPDPNEFFNPRRVADRTWNLTVAHGEKFPGLRMVVARIWAIFILFACPPAIALVRLGRHRRRIARGLCITCGYNLTGNVSGVCPECGTGISAGDGKESPAA